MISYADFRKMMAAFKVPRLNGTGNALVVGNAQMPVGSHVSAVLLGDSLSARNRAAGGIINAQTAIGQWNWANWLIGAPFVFTHNLGVSGDRSQSIFSRISAIKPNTQLVIVMAGTNDVLSMSSSASQGTIDSTFTAVAGYITSGVAALVASGRQVIIGNIPPNNAYSSAGDSRIQLLDRLNVVINALASGKVKVVDVFGTIWDSAQPTLRVCKASTMHSDGTHFAATGSYLIGKAAGPAFKAAYASCIPDVDIYDDFNLCRQLYSAFRSGTGGEAAVKTAGTGNLADGWRSINNAGTATFTLENANAYAVSSNYVGPIATIPSDIDPHWQEFNITAAVNNDIVRLMMPANNTISNSSSFPDSSLGGDLFFAEIDVEVVNPVNLVELRESVIGYFTVGTSPADQAYIGTTYVSAVAGSSDDFSSVVYPYPEGFRAVLRTPVLRFPENINTTVAHTMAFFVDMKFGGAGSALIRLGRPRIWHKSAGYL